MEAEEIFEQIDACQGALPFLSNDGRMHLADTRLTVFRSPENWAVFIEILNYSQGLEQFENWVGIVGNCLLEDDCVWRTPFDSRPIFTPVEDAPLWTAEEHWEEVNHRQFSILFGGERLDFTPSEADYAAAGVALNKAGNRPGFIEPGALLRFLCHHLDHPFFALESELRDLMQDVTNLELFLQTRDWHHPVYLVDSWNDDNFFEDDHIRNIPGFQILARAIASGDLTEWKAQDPATFNTSWESLEAIRNQNWSDESGINWFCAPPAG